MTIALNPRARVPQRFTATFSGNPQVIIKIEMVECRPVVRELVISSETTDLAEQNSRLPLRSQLLPAAIQAACKTTLYGGFTIDELRTLPVEDTMRNMDLSRGPALAEIPADHGAYEQAAQGTRRRPGRPRHVTEIDVLRQIATVYNERKSISDVCTRHSVSRSTAYRRVDEARKAGLVDD